MSYFNFDMAGPINLLPKMLDFAFSDPLRKQMVMAWSEQVKPDADLTGIDRRQQAPERLLLRSTIDPLPASSNVLHLNRTPPMGAQDVEHLVAAWLRTAYYGPEPICDGHCKKGVRVYSPRASYSESGVIAYVEPFWEEYHK